jgi:hypothetical protein
VITITASLTQFFFFSSTTLRNKRQHRSTYMLGQHTGLHHYPQLNCQTTSSGEVLMMSTSSITFGTDIRRGAGNAIVTDSTTTSCSIRTTGWTRIIGITISTTTSSTCTTDIRTGESRTIVTGCCTTSCITTSYTSSTGITRSTCPDTTYMSRHYL